MKRAIFVGALAASAFVLPAAADAAEATVKMAISGAGDHIHVHISNLMAQEVEKRVPGRVDWQLFQGAQMGRDDVVLNGLKTGTHVAGMPGSWVASVEPGMNLFEAPFLFANRDEARRVIRAVEGDLAKGLEQKGIILVGGIGELGFRQISNNVRPIVKPEDLTGVKLRTPGNAFRIKTFKTFGANPTPMNFAEVFVAIRQGVLDGQENPLPSIWAGKFHEVQKYISMSNHVFTPTVTLFSKKHWDSWPAEVRKAIDDAGRVANEFSFKYGTEKDQTLQADMKKQNPDLRFNDIDTPAFRKLAQPLYQELEGQVGKALWEKAMAALK